MGVMLDAKPMPGIGFLVQASHPTARPVRPVRPGNE